MFRTADETTEHSLNLPLTSKFDWGVQRAQVFRTADATTEHCKRDMVPVPRWVAALNAPAAFLDRCSESLGKAADVRLPFWIAACQGGSVAHGKPATVLELSCGCERWPDKHLWQPLSSGSGACYAADRLGADRTLLWAAPAPHGHEPRGAAVGDEQRPEVGLRRAWPSTA